MRATAEREQRPQNVPVQLARPASGQTTSSPALGPPPAGIPLARLNAAANRAPSVAAITQLQRSFDASPRVAGLSALSATLQRPRSAARPPASAGVRSSPAALAAVQRLETSPQAGRARQVVQLTERGKWWGSTIGGALGGLAGYTYGAFDATTRAATRGVLDAAEGYRDYGITGALLGGAYGAATGWLSGQTFTGYHWGSYLGGALGDWLTGEEPDRERVNLAQNMKDNLQSLIKKDNKDQPKLSGDLVNHPKVSTLQNLTPDEVRLLNWMHAALGAKNFNEVANGAQVRVPFDQAVFTALVNLGAQKRPSSHYSGVLFPSGFRQVVGAQYGTTGQFLPTVLFGKITDREGDAFMYFQPERNAYNPNTGPDESWRHIKDAFNYAVRGVQQGPYGTSTHTDADPITGETTPYQPTYTDVDGYQRALDFESWLANFVYTNNYGGQALERRGVSPDSSKAASHATALVASLGLTGLAYLAWEKVSARFL